MIASALELFMNVDQGHAHKSVILGTLERAAFALKGECRRLQMHFVILGCRVQNALTEEGDSDSSNAHSDP